MLARAGILSYGWKSSHEPFHATRVGYVKKYDWSTELELLVDLYH